MAKETFIPSDLIRAFRSASKSKVMPDPLNLSDCDLISAPKPENLSLRLVYLAYKAL